MGWPFGKKVGNRKHSKIDSLPPEMKATVEVMILDGSATYSEIVDYLQEHGYSLSVSSVKLEGMTPQQAENLREAHKTLLLALKGKSAGMEVGASFARDCIVRPNDVIMGKTEGYVRLRTHADSIGTMHTHPTGTPFSIDDVSAFLIDGKLQLATVVGNDGSVFVLRKKQDYDAAAVIHLWGQLEKEMPDWKSSAEKLLAIRRRFLKEMGAYGFEYQEFRAQR